jgi:tetratricopeptide (TPR) repeat protein
MSHRFFRCMLTIAIVIAWNAVSLGQTVPEEARRFMARGIAAIELANSAGDYALAAKEFEQAARLAPDWPAVYYNLGSVQSKAGDLASAMKSYRRYLELAPDSPDAAKVRQEIFKLEYRQERIRKVSELAGTWLAGTTSFTVSVNGSEFIASGSVGTDGIKVISDGGALVGKQDRIPRGNGEVAFKGKVDGLSIKGMRYRGPFTEGLSDCTIPGDQSEFTGTVSEDGTRITLIFQKGLYQANRDAGLFFGLDSCTGVTKLGEMPEKYVLTRKEALPKGVGLVGLIISENDPLLIAGVAPDMPAAEAGIKAGDRILRIDGKNVNGLTTRQIVELIRGQAGSRVAIDVERQGEAKPLAFTLIRKAA